MTSCCRAQNLKDADSRVEKFIFLKIRNNGDSLSVKWGKWYFVSGLFPKVDRWPIVCFLREMSNFPTFCWSKKMNWGLKLLFQFCCKKIYSVGQSLHGSNVDEGDLWAFGNSLLACRTSLQAHLLKIQNKYASTLWNETKYFFNTLLSNVFIST